MKEADIEKILINFDDSDISDISDTEDQQETETFDNLINAFEENETFLIEELSRQDQYEINISNIDVEENVCLGEAPIAEPSSISGQVSKFIPKKNCEFRWKKAPWTPPNTCFTQTYVNNEMKVPVVYFLEYFSENFLDQVLQATNQTSLLQSGKSVNLSKEEFLKFLALEITIGTLGYPRLDMYWSKATAIPCFSQCMTRPRFHSIRNNLKFTTATTNSDKLYKIRPLVDAFTQKLYIIPKDENLCVDEMMIPFKGKTALRQYMPKKPIKWGIKVFCLCSSKGMIYDFEIYQGKGTVSISQNLGFCADIVVYLTKTISDNTNFKLFLTIIFLLLTCYYV